MKHFLPVLLLGLAVSGMAQAANVAAGKELVTQKGCVACHGADGKGVGNADYPKLAGQYASYLEHALRAYRKGERTNAIMAGFAQALTDTEIADLAAFFASNSSDLHDLREMK